MNLRRGQSNRAGVSLFLGIFVLFSALPALASPRVDHFLEAEQKRNIKDIYKSGVFQNDLPVNYRAENSPMFRLPYFLIPLDSPELRKFSSGPLPEEVRKHHLVRKNGIEYFKYPVHPAALAYHQGVFRDRFEMVSSEKSEFLASPTASERALVIDPPAGKPYMVKVNLPLEINNRNRTMYPTEIRRGIWLNTVMREKVAQNPKLGNRLFIFPESYGLYPKIGDQAIGGMIFREFPSEFFNPGSEVIPLFSFLAISPETGKPLFFQYIPPTEDPARWFEKNILQPLLEIVDAWTYKEGISFELHSQNVLIELNPKDKTLTGRFGYRDLASAHLDLRTILLKGQEIPRLDLISDPQRELGFAYLKESELHWLHYFLKSQISDLFLIQMASHGLISRERREELKKEFWQKIVSYHQSHYVQLASAAAGSEEITKLPKGLKVFSFNEQDHPRTYKILKDQFGLSFGPSGEIVGVVLPQARPLGIRCERIFRPTVSY